MSNPHNCCPECHQAIRRISGVLWAVVGALIAQGYTLLNQITSL